MHVNDPRNIQSGLEIPTESYADQPYIVQTDDGGWLAVVTTGVGAEGETGQHVISLRSRDGGRSWVGPVDVEPATGPEASYAVLLRTGYGRVYVFYNHNSDDVRGVRADDPPYPGGVCPRVDSLGHFVFRFTDDGGRTWSPARYDVPMRPFAIDRENADGGRLLYFWNVGRPFVLDGRAYVPLTKVGGFGEGFFIRSEGALLMSPNLLTEQDPAQIVFETLPDGDCGLRAPDGCRPIAEEHSYVTLSDGGIVSVYRTVEGVPVEAYSRDGGRTFSVPQPRRYLDGRPMKHPRAANFQWRRADGRFLYWFHNHGGKSYQDRNPVWISGGIESDGPDGRQIRWSQPEILLYDDDPMTRISYPDLVEADGCLYVTQTQKDTARVHRLDNSLLEGLYSQFTPAERTDRYLLATLTAGEHPMPALPALRREAPHGEAAPHGDATDADSRPGFTLELEFTPAHTAPGQVLLDTMRTDRGVLIQGGITISTAEAGALAFTMGDGQTFACWHTDPFLVPGRRHHVSFIIDSGAHVILVVADGNLQDGGTARPFGFGRFSPWLRHAQGGRAILAEAIHSLRVHGAALRVSEAAGNARAQREAHA